MASRFIAGTSIELIGEQPARGLPRHALFDFDGTLSLIREGWPEVMIPLMVEVLRATDTGESAEQLRGITETYVMELNGKQTIYQMMRLANEVSRRGGRPENPLAYKAEYNRRLLERIEARRELLRSGSDPGELLVPGSLSMLECLKEHDVKMHLASGTDEPFVKKEAALLGLTPYFGEHIYGAQDDHRAFSKAKVIERILEENGIGGGSLIGFGDGYVEIQNIRATGGLAVAVASDEARRSGRPDVWKRNRLIGAGAHVVIPDFQEAVQLAAFLFEPQMD